MNRTIMITLFAVLGILVFQQTCGAAGNRLTSEDLKTFEQKASYALGMDVGGNVKNLPTDIDVDIFIQGLRDRLKGEDLLMTVEQAELVKKEIVRMVREKQKSEQNAIAEKNRETGRKFLEDNGNKKGVVTTKSGLQYLVLKEGDGPRPKAENTVKVHYKGTLIDGTEFDSSYKRNNPAVFPLSGVIRGWTEGLQLMKVGSKYRLFIPSNLAYGERGSGAVIPPGATLIFDVELLSIEK